MLTRVYRLLLLLLALTAAQWLVVAHAHEHPAVAVDQVCTLCVHAPGLDSPALAATGATVIEGACVAQAPPAVTENEHSAVPLVLRNRGPPVI